jgi:hypothetical protein
LRGHRGNSFENIPVLSRQEEVSSLVLFASVAVQKSLRQVVCLKIYDASVVKVDAANDLALLKAVGAFKPLPIAASRTVKLGGTVATVGLLLCRQLVAPLVAHVVSTSFQKIIQRFFKLLECFFQAQHQWGHFLPIQVKGIGVAEYMTETQVFIQRVVQFFRQQRRAVRRW